VTDERNIVEEQEQPAAEESAAGPELEPEEALAQDAAAEAHVHELAFADDLHQPGRFQLLDVMGERRGAHGVGLLQLTAWDRAVAGANLFENLIAAGLGQSAGDPRKLPIRQSTGFGRSHHVRASATD